MNTSLQRLNVAVKQLVLDSRQIQPGDTFVAYPGAAVDRRHYIGDAIDRGAGSVIWEAQDFVWSSEWRVPNMPVLGLQQRLSDLAAQLYQYPGNQMSVMGITGTNGKTSVCQWLAQLLTAVGRRCAVIGTLGNGLFERLSSTTCTTPDAIKVQQLLSDFSQQQAEYVAMEVSSHALDQGRVNAVPFSTAVLTNLSRDHLDYHGSMAAYADAKRQLFTLPGVRHQVLNLDDTFGRQLVSDPMVTAASRLGYGLTAAAKQTAEQHGIPYLSAQIVQMQRQQTQLLLNYQNQQHHAVCAVSGDFNISNILAALGALLLNGFSLEELAPLLSRLQPVNGRIQLVSSAQEPAVYIDYAHTPDALQQVLQALKKIKPAGARLVCVFGCGGDRDPGKRALMGEVACTSADYSIVTSDNPRTENPDEIIRQILQTVAEKDNYQVIPDRAQAIQQAVDMAAADDIVLIAGKGHETYQEVNGTRHPFDDAQIVRDCLNQRRKTLC